jgi:high affinity Mn2+ porin
MNLCHPNSRAAFAPVIGCLFTSILHPSRKPMPFARYLLFTLAIALPLHAQQPQPEPPTAQPDNPAPAASTIFPHSDTLPFLITGQTNIIFQAHAPFHSPYSGPNSFQSRGEYKTSLVGTLFLGLQLNRSPRYATDFILDFESTGGRGLSQALGLAGFTNLDVVRNPNLGSKPYIARIQLHQTLSLGGALIDSPRTPNSLAIKLPERRIDLRVGKLTLPDLFDLNSIGTDSRLQFMNWTTDNNGAWDYAADTRGYTYATVAEYDDKAWSLRYAFALMPTVANGIDLDWNARRARGQNTEFELRQSLLGPLVKPDRKGVLRILAFQNHANMGLYRDAIKNFEAHLTPTPEIAAHPLTSTVKYGFGGNFEQELTPDLRIYGRFGWNEGQHESYAYTEVDQTIAFGADYAMKSIGRPLDKAGITYVTNAIKRDHQNYLKLGGLGFLLGDGNLSYAREDILEAYYNLHSWRGLYYAFDEQFIEHPGYNQARGPVMVESVRMHVDF